MIGVHRFRPGLRHLIFRGKCRKKISNFFEYGIETSGQPRTLDHLLVEVGSSLIPSMPMELFAGKVDSAGIVCSTYLFSNLISK